MKEVVVAGVSLREIGTICGLNPSTVSRAIRGHPSISPETKERVLDAARRLGYQPNMAARALAGGKSRTLWFVVASLGSVVDWRVVRDATPYASIKDYSLLVAMHNGDSRLYERVIDQMGQGTSDGAIIVPRRHVSDVAALRTSVLNKMPIVFLDNYVEELPVPVVTTDNDKAVRELIKRCVESGVQEFLLLLGTLPNPIERIRLNGAIAELRERRLRFTTCQLDTVLPDTQRERPTAVIGSSQTDIHRFVVRNSRFFAMDTVNVPGRKLSTAPSYPGSDPLVFACFDEWIGEPAPASRVIVAIQDSARLSHLAIDRLLALIEGKQDEEPRISLVPPAEYCTVLPGVIDRNCNR